MAIRCKFKCNSVTKTLSSRGKQVEGKWVTENIFLYTATLTPVYSDDPESENRKFWDATPSGKFEVGTIKEMPWNVGEDYFIDITPAG